MGKIIMLLFAILSFSISAYAEPSKTVRYLMNDRVTMFDWGMYRIEEYLNNFDFEKLLETDLIKPSLSTVNYDWERNRIILNSTIYPTQDSLNKIPAKKLCEKILWAIRTEFGILRNNPKDPNSDIVVLENWDPVRFFRHKAFVLENEPNNLKTEILNIISIRIDLYASKNDKFPYSPVLGCECPLISGKILYDLDLK